MKKYYYRVLIGKKKDFPTLIKFLSGFFFFNLSEKYNVFDGQIGKKIFKPYNNAYLLLIKETLKLESSNIF